MRKFYPVGIVKCDERREKDEERGKKRIRKKDAQGEKKKKEETPCIDVLTTLKQLWLMCLLWTNC